MRLHGGVRVAGPEGGDDRPVVFLVELPPLPGRAAALEVAPDLPVPCRLHDAVERDEQRAVRGGHDAPVQGQVPGLELLVAGGLVAAGDAAFHLREVPGRRPQHHERQRLRLDAGGGSSSRRPGRSPAPAGRPRGPAGSRPRLAMARRRPRPAPGSPRRAAASALAAASRRNVPRPTSREIRPSASRAASASLIPLRVTPRSAASWRSVGSREPGPRPARPDSARISSASSRPRFAGTAGVVPVTVSSPSTLLGAGYRMPHQVRLRRTSALHSDNQSYQS